MGSSADATPAVQLAVMYTGLDAARLRLVRRLRVHTLEFPLAASRKQLLDAIDPAVVAAALVHKVMCTTTCVCVFVYLDV